MSAVGAPARPAPAPEPVAAPDDTGGGTPGWLRWLGSKALVVWAVLGLVYLLTPIVVIFVFSFNDLEGRFNFTWSGFTLDNWREPFAVPGLADSLWLSLRVAAISTLVATVFGTLIALALVRSRWRGSGIVNLLLILPLTTPEIVMGSSLLTLFLNVDTRTGFRTIVLAHVMFSISFVALTVRARIRGFDWTLEDAAMDLGAPPWRTFRKVTFPLIFPGVAAGAALSFALSLDDFIITFFVAGNEITFPLFIWGAAQRAVPPQINVLAMMILFVSLGLLGVGWVLNRWRAGLPGRDRR